MQSATWIAFACGGLVALFAGYAYAWLSACYPSPGGIIDFFRLSLPAVLTIALSFLYLVTLILTVAMVARAFGAYAVQLFHQGNESALLPEVYTAFIIIAVGLMNITGSHAVGKVEVLLVGTKLVIIIALVATGVFTVDTTLLNISSFSGDTLFSAVGLTFFAYARVRHDGKCLRQSGRPRPGDAEGIYDRHFIHDCTVYQPGAGIAR